MYSHCPPFGVGVQGLGPGGLKDDIRRKLSLRWCEVRDPGAGPDLRVLPLSALQEGDGSGRLSRSRGTEGRLSSARRDGTRRILRGTTAPRTSCVRQFFLSPLWFAGSVSFDGVRGSRGSCRVARRRTSPWDRQTHLRRIRCALGSLARRPASLHARAVARTSPGDGSDTGRRWTRRSTGVVGIMTWGQRSS